MVRDGAASAAAGSTVSDVFERERVRTLVLTDLAQKAIGVGVSGRALVEIVDLVVLGSLAGAQQPVDRRDPSLKPQPQRKANARRVGHRDLELLHSLFQAAAMAAFGLGHAAEDLGLAIGQGGRSAHRQHRRRSRLPRLSAGVLGRPRSPRSFAISVPGRRLAARADR
jgi:hypothetical protein